MPAADVDEKINRYLEIVAIYRDRLNLDVMVVNTYLNILALKPDHPAALAALAARYEAQGRYGDLVQVLTRQAEAADGRGRRASRCTGASPRCGPTSWASTATRSPASRRSSSPIRPTPRPARASRTSTRRGAPGGRCIEVYRKELPHLDAAARRARLIEMARVAGDRLNDVREAIALYNQVLAIEERDADALTGPGDAVRSRAALAGADRDPRAAAPERGRAERRRGRAGAARTARRRCSTSGWARRRRRSRSSSASRSCSPRTRARRGRCARSTRRRATTRRWRRCTPSTGAFGDLCDQLTSLADRTADMAARTRLLERVALIAQEKLNQPERALKAYERILATDPRNRSAALALLPLYRTAQKWPRLLATYEVLLGPAAAGDGTALAEQLELYAEARKICEQRLGSKALAFQWCARAFEAAPKNEAVRTDLERLAGEADEWGNLAALYDARTAASTDAEERLWLLRRTLRIAATRLFRPQDARKAAEQILAEVGFDEEADAALEQILTQTKAWARSGQAAARARRSRARRRRARAPAVPHRAARGGAGGRSRPPRRRPGRRSSRPSRPTSARCGR